MPGDDRLALYFGCRREVGHYLHSERLHARLDVPRDLGFPWTIAHLDGTLLKNGKHLDVYDGKVFWTCGGRPLWLAFFWWDRSIDKRMASNSGFYVRGFEFTDRQAAFDYAGSVFPDVIARQRHPLILQPSLAEIAAGRRVLQGDPT